ncbi:MAG: aldo/keto reductase [Myxococcales bacterium]
MRYTLLGRSGLRVSEACLGTMTFGEDWGWGASKEESRKMFDAFVEHGGNFIDTANVYTGGTSEKFVGEFVAPERDRFVLATKYTLMTRPGDPNSAGNQRKNMVQAIEASLKRLGTDYVDLYWVHAGDGLTPIDEVMRALDDLVRAGKVLHVGVSDTPAWIVSQANTLAELRGWSRFAAIQIEYSLIERTPERDLLAMARAFDLSVLAWGVIGGGVLTGKYAAGASDSKRSAANQWRTNDRNLRIGNQVMAIAKELACPPSQVAIAWVRQRSSPVLPILGARSVGQLLENLGALELTLSVEHLALLDVASTIELGFPYDFLGLESIKTMVRGDLHTRIDAPRR